MIKNIVRKIIYKLVGGIEFQLKLHSIENKFLIGQLLSKQLLKNINNIKTINEAEFKVYSQWGDDGIIQFLVNKLPNIPKSFIEFGVETYIESNTRFLLMYNNWKGLVMDGSQKNVEYIQNDEIYWRYNLKAINKFITKENINKILLEEKFTGEIGILHIDIDGNDYWVWKEISVVTPAIVIVEYNAVFGDKLEVSIPYNANFFRTEAHYSNLYWGCSLQALISLGKEKGYTFIGCNSNGNNAYFIIDNLAQEVNINASQYKNSSFRESRDMNGNLTYITSDDRIDLIKELDVFNIKENRIVKLKELI